MITDTLDNAHFYHGLGNRIKQAFDYLQQADFLNLIPGKYEVDGENIFAIVNEYSTKSQEECQPEAHKKYIDIQYMVKGRELFGYTPLKNGAIDMPYDEDKDVAFFDAEMSYTNVEENMFILFYPHDIHQPEVSVKDPEQVKKVVMKIRI